MFALGQGRKMACLFGMSEHIWGEETVLGAVLAVDEDRLQLLEEEQVLLKQEDQVRRTLSCY